MKKYINDLKYMWKHKLLLVSICVAFMSLIGFRDNFDWYMWVLILGIFPIGCWLVITYSLDKHGKDLRDPKND